MNEVERYANYLMHFGRSKRNGAPGRGSGRYPLGSGEEPYQYRDREGSLTNDGKEKFKKLKKEALLSLDNKKLNNIVKSSDSDSTYMLHPKYKNDVTLKKGSMVYRMSSIANETNGPGFIFFTDDDMDIYNSIDSLGFDVHYKNIYKVKKDIKIPSIENITKTYIDVVLKDSDTINSIIDGYYTYTKQKYEHNYDIDKRSQDYIKKYANEAAKSFCNDVNKNIYENAYKYVASQLKGTQKSITDTGYKLFKALQDQGYNAIPDFNDRAGIAYGEYYSLKGLGKFPLFIFDKDESLHRENVIDALDTEKDTIEYNRPRYTFTATDSNGKRKTYDQYGREYVKKKLKQ